MTATKLVLCALLLVYQSSAQQPDAEDSLSPEVKALMDAGVASFKEAHYDEAVANFRKATQLEPGNEKAHLYLATAYAYQVVPNLETPENLHTASSALAEFDIVLKAHPKDLTANLSRAGCDALIAKNKPLVDEGIVSLTKAIELKPDYDDAMQYLQLTYRRHADLQCGDPTGISADLKLIEQWSRKAMEARKEKEKNW